MKMDLFWPINGKRIVVEQIFPWGTS
eukprot:COSAG06_NODE_62983_length_263_cov_0.951220_1_plen_25_part_10